MSALRARDQARRGDLAAVALLQRIAVVANEASSLREAIQAALDEVCAHTGWPVGHAYLRSEDSGGELVPTGIWHLDDPSRYQTFRRVTEATELRLGAGLPGRIAASGEPAWIVDVRTDPNFPRTRVAAELGVRGAFGFPLLASQRVVGVLEFFSEVSEEPDAALLELMAYVGTQLGRVAEREAAAAALVAQVEHTRLLIESAYDAFVSIDASGVTTGWNAAAEAMFGWTRAEAVGRSLAETIVPSAHRDAHKRGIAHFLATGDGPILNQRLELTALHRDGHEIPIELAVWPVEANGTHTFSAFIRNISERKEHETEIIRLAAIVESSDDAMVAKSIDGTVLSWNRGAERLYGYEAHEVIGGPISKIFPPDRIDELSEILERLGRGESIVHHESVRRAKNGKLIDVSLSISPIRDAFGVIVGAASITRDVSEQKQAERGLRESEARLQMAQQIAGIGSWAWDVEPDFVSWSPQMYRIFGVDDRDFTPSLEGYLGLVHPEDREHAQSVIQTAFATHDAFQFAHRGLPRNGDSRIFLCTGDVIVSEGRVVLMAGTSEDITERKRAEDSLKLAFERERETVTKLRELDQAKTIFISSVSHELRTPLTSIIGYLDLFREIEGKGLRPNQLEMLDVIERNSGRLLELIEDLLTFSRLQAGTFGPSIGRVSVAALFASVREAILPQISARALDIRFDGPDGLELMADAAQLERVLLNLLSNAIKFTPHDGSIVVEAELSEDNTALISVRDTGIGVPENEIPSLFSPFFRASNAETMAIPGTGLGLAIVKAIVDGHGGAIELARRTEGGTVVRVRIPAATD
jgi:PAS domain S-box-containing protein